LNPFFSDCFDGNNNQNRRQRNQRVNQQLLNEELLQVEDQRQEEAMYDEENNVARNINNGSGGGNSNNSNINNGVGSNTVTNSDRALLSLQPDKHPTHTPCERIYTAMDLLRKQLPMCAVCRDAYMKTDDDLKNLGLAVGRKIIKSKILYVKNVFKM
jgi:hypothetical protein